MGGFTKGEPVRGMAQLVGRDNGSMTVSASQSSRSEDDGVGSLENGRRYTRGLRRSLTFPIILECVPNGVDMLELVIKSKQTNN